ncbi:MAG: hypothetical protein D6723_08170 [Acidobacteria bacterium]|nr:MAG: hypothetical protein D6723_08170 [Acidobacteriota bacterium]
MMRGWIISTLIVTTFVLLGGETTARAAGFYTVKGHLFYYDGRSQGMRPVDQYNGAANVTFYIYDEDQNSSDDLLATGIVDWDGRFEATFYFDQSSESYADIYIHFIYHNSKWEVVASDGGHYWLYTETKPNRAYGIVDFGNLFVPRNTNHEKAMWVFQSMNEGWNYVEYINAWDVGDQITVQWPGHPECPTSCADWDGIQIAQNRAGDTVNVIHEYGHMVNFRAWGGTGPDPYYCLTEGPNADNCGHNWNSWEENYTAFMEGWANFVAYATLGCIGNNDCLDIEDRSYNVMDAGNEGNVTAVLGDILDDHPDSHAQDIFKGYDGISWNFYGMVWILGHMSEDEIDAKPTIKHYVNEIREVYDDISYIAWHELMHNSWVIY